MVVGCTSHFKMTSIVALLADVLLRVGCTSLFKMTSIEVLTYIFQELLDVPHFLR